MRLRIAMVSVLCCLAQLAAHAQPLWSSAVSPEARRTVERVVGSRLKLDLQATVDRFGRHTIRLVGKSGEADVDAETGLLVACGLNGPCSPPEKPWPEPISAEQAYRIAEDFVVRAGLPVKGFERCRQEFNDHADGGSSWFISWCRHHDGVRMPFQVYVDLNALTGEVISYSLVDVELRPGLTLRISAAEAVRRAATRAGVRRWQVHRIEPSIWFEPSYPGPLVLRWEVDLADADPKLPHGSLIHAIVNAETGAVTSLAVAKGPIAAPSGLASKGKLGRVRAPKLSAAILKRAHWPATVFARMKKE